ncbi:uncharacterized protein [Nicotiana tomentosiformis]|uniref:uncharacterized protein n=1 Tax=Nicotiana tomentosiformis TaxID=4098 RepID=UPI00388CC707
MVVDIKQLQLHIFGDSKLVINQILDSYEVKKSELVPYHKYAQRLVVPPPNDYEEEKSEVEHLASVLEQRNSSMYYAAANGLAEAFNKTLCNLLKMVISKSNKDWHERMEEDLWAYRTTYRTPTQATPYSLIYGVEAVLPLECQISSLRFSIHEGLTDEENTWLHLEELEALDEKRLEAQQSLECHQARMSRSFNKRVRLRSFQVGDQVLVVKSPIITSRRFGGKFSTKWDGPYIIQEVYSSGAYKIVDSEGLWIGPINGKFMKRYYP